MMQRDKRELELWRRKSAKKQKHWSKCICHESKEQEGARFVKKKKKIVCLKEGMGRTDCYEITVCYSANIS